VFERFTERARQVVVLAQDEARLLKHNYIGTEHILLGLLREEEGLAARLLESMNVAVEEVRAQVARIVGVGDEVTSGQIPFTPRAKKTLELALREALGFGHNYIGTEHVLLGLAREGDGVAMRLLLDFGVDGERIRSEIIRALSGPGQRPGFTMSAPVYQFPESVTADYEPKIPPISTDVAAEIERVRKEKEALLERQEFEAAARLRHRERRLVSAARALEHAWVDEPERPPTPRAVTSYGQRSRTIDVRMPYAVSVVVCAVAFPIGLLAGWLIWG
jgi:hypothetical protein